VASIALTWRLVSRRDARKNAEVAEVEGS